MTTLPIKDGFSDDESARDYEPNEHPYEFLITGRPPRVGQRIQSYVDLDNDGRWGRFSGIVTHVGEEPSFDQWVANSFWTCDFGPDLPSDFTFRFDDECKECGADPACWSCKIFGKENKSQRLTLAELKDRCKAAMGALHGQEITTYAYLKIYDNPAYAAPFCIGRIYKICFKLNDIQVRPCVSPQLIMSPIPCPSKSFRRCSRTGNRVVKMGWWHPMTCHPRNEKSMR